MNFYINLNAFLRSIPECVIHTLVNKLNNKGEIIFYLHMYNYLINAVDIKRIVLYVTCLFVELSKKRVLKARYQHRRCLFCFKTILVLMSEFLIIALYIELLWI